MASNVSCCHEGPERAEKQALSGAMAAWLRQGDDDRPKTCFKVADEDIESGFAGSHLSVNVRSSASLFRYGFILKRPLTTIRRSFWLWINQLTVVSLQKKRAHRLRLWVLCGVMAGLCLGIVVVWAVRLPPRAVPAAGAKLLKVVSLDGCADQYVLGLVPRDQILALSDRARLPDSYFRERAAAVRRIQPRLETLLALDPDVVVRTWGGDLNLIKALEKHHIRIVNINDITNYDQAKPELFRVAKELGQEAGAGIEAHRFDLAMAAIQPVGEGRTVLYYTPTGTSAGPDTMVGDMLQRLGFKLETQNKGFFYLSPEVLLSMKPDIFALAFYDDHYAMRRVPGRNPLVRAQIAATPNFTLSRQSVSCSGWFTAYDLSELSQSPLTGSGGLKAVP